MFSSNFLSGGNPLSAVSSAVNKFGRFGDEEEKQQQQPPGPSKQKDPQHQGNGQPASQGPLRQSIQQTRSVGRGGQGAGRDGSQPQGAGRGSPVQQGAGRIDLSHQGVGRGGLQQGASGGGSPKQGVGKGVPQQQGPSGPGSHPGGAVGSSPPSAEPQVKGGTGAGVKSLCPVCKNTELNLKFKDSPNHNTCTQCKSVVCNMCGFSPPDSTVSTNS